MNSIFVRILLSTALLFVVSSGAFVWTSVYLMRRDPPVNNFMRRVLDAQLADAREDWEKSRSDGAAAAAPEAERTVPGPARVAGCEREGCVDG